MIAAKLAAVVVIAYLVGSIPFGVIVGRREAGVDVRQHGSGKMGMANVLRTAGRRAAIAVFLLDLGKGALAVFLAGVIIGGESMQVGSFQMGALFAQILAGLAAIAGHILPVFVKFKGGRGVVTFFGGLFVLCPLVALFGGEVFIIGTIVTKYVSLGSLAGTICTYILLVPLAILSNFPMEYLIYTFIGTVIIFIMHRDNINRLIAGKERRLGGKAEGS